MGCVCGARLSACLIHLPESEGRYRGLVTTQPIIPACDILRDNGKRWTREGLHGLDTLLALR